MGMMSGALTIGTPAVATSGSSSPMPWLLLTIASVGAALWVARRPVPSRETVPAPAHASARANSSTTAKGRSSHSGNSSRRHSSGTLAGRHVHGPAATPEGVIAGFTRRHVLVGAGLVGVALVVGVALGSGLSG
jgi:hypothetical protein